MPVDSWTVETVDEALELAARLKRARQRPATRVCRDCGLPVRKFGRNRNGSQRYACDLCRKTFTDPKTAPRDRRFLPQAALLTIRYLLDRGHGIRAIERLTGVHRDTVMKVRDEMG